MRVKFNRSSLLSFTYILGIEPDISSLFSKQWFLGDHILGYSRPLGENSVTTSHSGCCIETSMGGPQNNHSQPAGSFSQTLQG